MRIAVNTRFLLPTKMEGFGWYTYEVTKRLVEQHPEHEFIFFFDRAFDQKFIFGKNVTPVVLNPPARHPILFYIWNEIAVRKALKKYKIDVYFSPDGYLSLKSDVPQVNVIHDINFEHNPLDIPKRIRKYLHHYFPLFAKKARHILTVSEYSKQDICATYGISPDKITVAWNGASEVFQPIDTASKKEVQHQFSDGNPYFLFVGAIHPRKNVHRLIQAFEQFKNNHPDDKHQLLIVGEALFSNNFDTLKLSPKIQKDIKFTGHLTLEELARVMAAADIFTFVPYFEGFGIPLVEAMRCGTPVLSGNLTSLPEVGGDAVLYCDPMDVNDIAEKLTFLALDTELQASLSKKGLERSRIFSWDTTAQSVWKVIEETATN